MDVVGVERQHWSVDPFAGEIRDGYLYGRGAIDDKGMLAANLMTMLLEEAPASDTGSEMFASIAETAHKLDPKMAVVPYLSAGVTDSARLRRLGVKAYGVLPFPMLQSDEERMHGHDERVPLESLHFGTRLIFGAIERIAR